MGAQHGTHASYAPGISAGRLVTTLAVSAGNLRNLKGENYTRRVTILSDFAMTLKCTTFSVSCITLVCILSTKMHYILYSACVLIFYYRLVHWDVMV